MKINIIAAMANNMGIGKDGKLPWNKPKDMRHFKRITIGVQILKHI